MPDTPLTPIEIGLTAAIVTVEDEELGPTRVCNVFPRFSRTPGRVQHLGPSTPGEHAEEILEALGYSDEQVLEIGRAHV